jgi:hypothetical protein
VKITSWGYNYILEELPFSAGLQMIQADTYAHGHPAIWQNDSVSTDVDAFATIEATLAKYGKV